MKKSHILSIIACMLLAVSYVSAQTISPTMDTFIQSNVTSSYFGTVDHIEMRNGGAMRISFMDIPVNTISSFSAVTSAMLNVYLWVTPAAAESIEVYQVLTQGTGDAAINESDKCTWGNAIYTLGSSALASITLHMGDGVGTKYSFNLTNFIQGLTPGTQKVTLCFKVPTTGAGGPEDFCSKEYTTNTAYRPALVYTIPVTGVSISPGTASVITGATTNLTSTVTPSSATNPTLTWSSDATGVATVSSSGVVTGVTVGTAHITATTQDGSNITSNTSTVTVSAAAIPVTSVTVTPSPSSVHVGATTNLTATIAPSNATNKTVNWSSSNTGVATVSGGVVTGVTAGTATITATSQDGSFTSTSSITVNTVPVTGVTVSPASATVVAGAYIPLTATVAPSNATNKTVLWSTSNSNVARVSVSGVVTGMGIGSATISATTQDGSFTSMSSVTVSAPAANYVLNPGFELDTAPSATATNWYEWGSTPANGNVVTGNNSLSDAIGGTPHSGTKYLEFAGSGTYEVNYKQDISGLPNGTYTLKFWCRGNNASGAYYNIGGTYTGWGTLPSQWTQKTIPNVSVTNGGATINFNYQTTTGGSLNIDDVELTLNQYILVTGINAVSPASKTLSLNETTTLVATTIPSNASNSVINWNSSNTSVATVSAAGLVTAVSAGTATITATTSENGFTSSSVITVLANYVVNPGFETDGAPIVKATGWAEWSGTPAYTDNSNVITGNVGLGNVIGGAPHSGSYYVEVAPTVANATAYGLLNYQTVTLPNGTYTLTGWFRGNGGSGYLNVGAAYNNFNFANLTQWTQLTINNVVISTGSCQVLVNYSTSLGEKLDIDDIQLRPVITISGSQTSTALTNSNADISVTSSGDLTIDASRSVQNINVDGGGKVTLNNGIALTINNLTLNSDGTNGTATFVDKNSSVGNLITNGTTTVQQYLTKGRNWYISSPVTGATSNVFSASSGNPLYWYDEVHGSTVPWATITNSSTTLVPMQGYVANMAADGPVTFTGTLNSIKSITLHRTTGQTKEGFNLVGNPYPAHITISKSITDGANALNTIWYRTATWVVDPDPLKSKYVYSFQTCLLNADDSYTGTPDGITPIIAPMQAFWLRTNANGTTLDFSSALSSHQSSNPLKVAASKNTNQPMLRIQVTNSIAVADETVIYSNPNASNGYDMYDAPKMFNNSISVAELFTVAGTENLAINGLNTIPYDTEIPLGFNTLSSGTFSIKASQIANFEVGTQIIIKDNLNMNNPIITDLSDGSIYSFTSAAASNITTRFSLVLKAPSVATGINSINDNALWISTDTNGKLQINGLPTGETLITIYNAFGQKIISKNLTHGNAQLDTKLEAGIYLVTVTNSGITHTKKIILD